MCPDGEVMAAQNKKYLLKDLAMVNPWDSKPAPLVAEPAPILPGEFPAAPSQIQAVSGFAWALFWWHKGHMVPAITLSNAGRCLLEQTMWVSSLEREYLWLDI